MTHPQPASPISLMAAGELRDALTALRHGDTTTAAYALASIDPHSWTAIEHRLATVGTNLTQLTTEHQ